MNVFVLCTGRCGSTTFAKACGHITNYSSSHESRIARVGHARLAYPQNHIEADNRLSWLLGRLDRAYGNSAFYVHLRRNDAEVARSHLAHWNFGIMKAYRSAVLYLADRDPSIEKFDFCLDYCATVNSNIEFFLRDKTHKMNFQLEHCDRDFLDFWSLIRAQGDRDAALAEWRVQYNATASHPRQPSKQEAAACP